MKYEIGTYLVCLGNHNDYLPACVAKTPKTMWQITHISYHQLPIAYTLRSINFGGCIRDVSDYWLDIDFRHLSYDEAVVKDILE